MTAFVDGFVSELGNRFNAEDTRYIRDTLYAFTLNFDVRPIQTGLAVTEYQLPMEYKMFMVSKKQDGRMNDRSAAQYGVTGITTDHYRTDEAFDFLFDTM